MTEIPSRSCSLLCPRGGGGGGGGGGYLYNFFRVFQVHSTNHGLSITYHEPV